MFFVVLRLAGIDLIGVLVVINDSAAATSSEAGPLVLCHGPASTPGALINAQRAYLLTLASHVKELAKGRSELNEDDKKELERRMIEYLPNGGLTSLIAMNADPIAHELNADK
jgi:hypothetical protein